MEGEELGTIPRSLIMYVILIGCAVALVVSMVIIIVEARGARQETGQPGKQAQPSLPAMRHISMARVAQHASVIDTSGNPDSCLCGACFNLGPGRGFWPSGGGEARRASRSSRPRCASKATSKGFSLLFDGVTARGRPRPSHSSQFPGPPPAGHGYRIGSTASGESSTTHFLGPMRASQSHLALISEVPPLVRDPR